MSSASGANNTKKKVKTIHLNLSRYLRIFALPDIVLGYGFLAKFTTCRRRQRMDLTEGNGNIGTKGAQALLSFQSETQWRTNPTKPERIQ